MVKKTDIQWSRRLRIPRRASLRRSRQVGTLSQSFGKVKIEDVTDKLWSKSWIQSFMQKNRLIATEFPPVEIDAVGWNYLVFVTKSLNLIMSTHIIMSMNLPALISALLCIKESLLMQCIAYNKHFSSDTSWSWCRFFWKAS